MFSFLRWWNRPTGRLLALWLSFACGGPPSLSYGAGEGRIRFSLPAAAAEQTLELFADQAAVQTVYLIDEVRGVATPALAGVYTPGEALERLLAHSALEWKRDEKSGAFVIKRVRADSLTPGAAIRDQSRSGSSTKEKPSTTMKRSRPIAFLLTALGALFSSPAPASAAATAGLAGQVSNAATGSYLEGAAVTIAGTSRATITDREGRYQFNDLEPGTLTLEVGFAGLDVQRVTVALEPGKRLVRDFALTAEIYKLDRFIVAGEREGTAKAETLQRQAPNVKNVVSSDAFGNEASGNVGELLQRIAGITGNYNGPDVFQVSIRGVGPDLNSVTMDGQQVSSSQSAGAGRQFEFEQASLGNIETIEVTKAPTPDMDGASIGGSVNLVTKSAFDRAAARVFSYNVGFATQPGYSGYAARWKQPVKGFGPSVNFSYSDVFGAKKNLGVTLTGTFHSQPVGGAFITHAFEQRAAPGPVFDYRVSRNDVAGATRARVATGLKLDYRWSERTTVSFNSLYNYYHENNDTRQHVLQTVGVASAATPQVLATVDAAGNRTGGGYIHPDYAQGVTRVFPHPTLSFSDLSVGTNNKSGRTFLFSPSVRHRFPGLSLDYRLSYSNAATYYDTDANGSKAGGRHKGTATARLGNIGWTVDRRGDSIYPFIAQTAGPDMLQLNNYSNLVLTSRNQRGYDSVIGGKLDLRKDLPVVVPAFVKTGFTAQRQERKFWDGSRRYNYTGVDGVLGTADDNRDLGQFLDRTGITTSDQKKYYGSRGGIPPWPYSDGIARHKADYPELWKEDVAYGAQLRYQSLRKIRETISAAYALGNLQLGPVAVLGGVRFESTEGSGEGPLNYISPEERARRAAWVGPVTDAETRRRAEAQYGRRTTNRGQYDVVLPGLHAKYEIAPGFLTRLSWSTGVGRPGFGNIIPNTTANDDNRTVAVSNPELKPQYAHNYDFSAEYYFRPQGMVSLGLFRKRIADYIFTDSSQFVPTGNDNGFDGDYAGYRITTRANGGFAKIEGLEISYQQQLSFLPGWLRGFGVYANATALRTEGNYGGTAVLTTSSLPNFINRSANLGLSYRGYDLDLRLQAIHRGKYLTSNSANPALVQYQEAKTTWNWKSRYAVSRHLSVFFDLENIFSVPLNTVYAAYADRVVSSRTFHTKIVAGLSGRY